MQQDTPEVTVTLDRDYQVRFDYARLVAIEAATSRTIYQVTDEISGFANANGQIDMARMGLGFVFAFLSGCTGQKSDDLLSRTPLRAGFAAFFKVLPFFTTAVNMLSGEESPGGNPQMPAAAASAGSGPGPESSLA